MKRFILFFGFSILVLSIQAQVGIHTEDPKAALDIEAVNSNNPTFTDGILIPRIQNFPASQPTVDQHGMLVFLATTVGLNPSGFYYWDADTTAWVYIQTKQTGWSTTGNSGTSETSNFLGTTDNTSLVFKVNNQMAGKIDPVNSNTSLGYLVAHDNTVGTHNTALGKEALFSNVAGKNATAIGTRAMYYTNNASSPFTNQNVSIGYEALRGSTTPADNTGNSNVAIGYQTMLKNTTGTNNNAIGINALYNNTNGNQNVAIGNSALFNNTTGSNNIAIGGASLSVNSTGSENLAMGINALFLNSTGHHNIAFGNNSLLFNTTGKL
jgi:hypothetical protein